MAPYTEGSITEIALACRNTVIFSDNDVYNLGTKTYVSRDFSINMGWSSIGRVYVHGSVTARFVPAIKELLSGQAHVLMPMVGNHHAYHITSDNVEDLTQIAHIIKKIAQFKVGMQFVRLQRKQKLRKNLLMFAMSQHSRADHTNPLFLLSDDIIKRIGLLALSDPAMPDPPEMRRRMVVITEDDLYCHEEM